MKISIRKVGDYKELVLSEDRVIIDCGFLDEDQALYIAEYFFSAAEELAGRGKFEEWIKERYEEMNHDE